MLKYIIKRVILIAFTCFIILSLTFILMKCLKETVSATSAAAQYAYYNRQVSLGYMYYVENTPNAVYDVKVVDGNNVYLFNYYSIWHQYGMWLKNIVTEWDWGTSTSIRLNDSAMNIIMERLPYSIKLNIVSIIIAVPLGFLFGIIAALKKNTFTDHAISTAVMIFISVPSYVIISFLLIWLSYNNGWLPSKWPSSLAPLSERIKGYIIPVMCLCFGTIASFTRYTRAELCEIMSSDFLLLARTKGLTKSQTVVRHALRNSLVPIVPMIIGEFVSILSGSMILEQIYSIPGIGFLFVTAMTNRDYSVVMVDMAIYTTIGLFATLLVDLSYGIVDPRIRMGAKK